MFLEVGIFVLLAVVRIDAQSDCTGQPDGIIEAGCHSYTLCTAGEGTTVDCPLPDEAYNDNIQQCDAFANTPPPCGVPCTCTGVDDRYPIFEPVGEECEAFCTCSGGSSHGVTKCNPPGLHDLVFDDSVESCNWRELTLPPCGTFAPTAPPRF